MMRPCDAICISLVAIESSKPRAQSPQLEIQESKAPEQEVLVQHITNSAKYSFITEKRLRELLIANYDSKFPTIYVNNDTVVVIQWHYPTSRRKVKTKHLVVRESSFDIILRKEDWETPILEFLPQINPKNLGAALKPHSTPENRRLAGVEAEGLQAHEVIEGRQDSDSENESKSEKFAKFDASTFSRRPSDSDTSVSDGAHTEAAITLQQSSGVGCTGGNEGMRSRNSKRTSGYTLEPDDVSTPRAESENRMNGECNQDTDGDYEMNSEEDVRDDDICWGIIEPEDPDSPDGPDNTVEDAYWHWSVKDRRWYHQDDDKTIRWFPEDIAET